MQPFNLKSWWICITFLSYLSIEMVAKKRKSKRQTLQQKYRIIKRTKEHTRKLKKGVIVSGHSKKKVRDSIPNAWPYKEDLLKEIQAAKEKMEENKLRMKDKRKEEIVSWSGGIAALVLNF